MKMITRHNYEEFFILYMDNELGSDERRMVETFVQQHPDLKEELDILLQFKLEPDTHITFSGKEELMKVNGDTPVTLANYEEWLLLYLDNELTAEQKLSVDRFLAVRPAIQKEFSLLQCTRFQPEDVVYANKKGLYRKEENVRPLARWRVAAAVLVFVLGATTVILVNNKKVPGNKEAVAAVPGNDQETPGINDPVVQPETKEAIATSRDQETPVYSPGGNDKRVPVTIKNAVAVNEKTRQSKEVTQKNIPGVTNEVVTAKNDKPSNNLPAPLHNPNIVKNEVANVTAKNNDVPKEIINPKNLSTDVAVTNNSTPPLNIVQASYPAGSEDLDQTSGKKTKLRGFFRKVTRTFEKRTNMDATTDDNKLLVAGLSFKLK